MDADYGIDIEAIKRVVDEADVFVVRFSLIDQRLLVDARTDESGKPFISIVPPVGSAEERYRFLKEQRPSLPLPEQITVFHWPRAIRTMRDLGVWEHIEQRFAAIGGEEAATGVRRAFQEGQRLERADVLAAIRGGEGYETVWERASSE